MSPQPELTPETWSDSLIGSGVPMLTLLPAVDQANVPSARFRPYRESPSVATTTMLPPTTSGRAWTTPSSTTEGQVPAPLVWWAKTLSVLSMMTQPEDTCGGGKCCCESRGTENCCRSVPESAFSSSSFWAPLFIAPRALLGFWYPLSSPHRALLAGSVAMGPLTPEAVHPSLIPPAGGVVVGGGGGGWGAGVTGWQAASTTPQARRAATPTGLMRMVRPDSAALDAFGPYPA